MFDGGELVATSSTCEDLMLALKTHRLLRTRQTGSFRTMKRKREPKHHTSGLGLFRLAGSQFITSTDPARSQDLRTTVWLPAGGDNHETQRTLSSTAADTISNSSRQEQLFPWNEVHVRSTPPPKRQHPHLVLHHQTITRILLEKNINFSPPHAAQALYHAPQLILPPHFRSPSRVVGRPPSNGDPPSLGVGTCQFGPRASLGRFVWRGKAWAWNIIYRNTVGRGKAIQECCYLRQKDWWGMRRGV